MSDPVKKSLFGNLLLVFGISLMLTFLATQMCERSPALTRWMGGNCWFDESRNQSSSHLTPHHSAVHFFHKEEAISNLELQKAAVYSLGENVTPEVRDALWQLVYSDAPIELRKAALHVLGQNAGEKTVEKLSNLAGSREPLELRKSAIHALEQVGSPAARQVLVDLLEQIINLEEMS